MKNETSENDATQLNAAPPETLHEISASTRKSEARGENEARDEISASSDAPHATVESEARDQSLASTRASATRNATLIRINVREAASDWAPAISIPLGARGAAGDRRGVVILASNLR